MRVEITRQGNEWIAEYIFDRESAVWVFPRTDVTRDDQQSWRPLSWTVETRGVRLERRGWYDVLVARKAVPLRVRIRFTPFAKGLQNDYTPALRFTDGSVALFLAQFDTFPMASDQIPPTKNCAPLPSCSGSRWQILPMHSRCKSCLYCGLVNYMTAGDPPPVTKWKRPVLLVAGIALTVCTVLALRFAWERTDGTFFATVSAILNIIALLGVVIAVRGCDTCVARFLGKTL